MHPQRAFDHLLFELVEVEVLAQHRHGGRTRPGAAAIPVLSETLNLDQLEKQMIERALRMHHFNISLAAAELGLSRGALYRRMDKHGL